MLGKGGAEKDLELQLVPGAVVGGNCAGAGRGGQGSAGRSSSPSAGSRDVLDVPGREAESLGLLNLL